MNRILFISHSKRDAFYYNDASARYRCVFPAEYFNDIGLQTDVVHFNDLNKINLKNYGTIIFHRPQFSLKLKWLMYKIKRLGIQAVVDFDDLLFNPSLSISSAAVQSGYMSERLAKKHAVSYLKALKLFSTCWVSTNNLAKQISAIIPSMEVVVCHNKIPQRWPMLTSLCTPEKRLENKIIRYMPGTSHHKHDFNKIEDFLVTLLQSDVNIKLEIIGPLKFNTSKFPKKPSKPTLLCNL
jgi:hypothetical protein